MNGDQHGECDGERYDDTCPEASQQEQQNCDDQDSSFN
jgi:hypothetical protein